MQTSIKTRYAGGVFQPLEDVDLPEGSDVVVRIEGVEVLPTLDFETGERVDEKRQTA